MIKGKFIKYILSFILMRIKEVNARVVLDSRKEETIEVLIKTNSGIFSASSPSGKSKGKFETPAFVGSVEECINKIVNLSSKISEIEINEFKDLVEIEKIADKNVIGANSLFALETAILKALSLEQGKELWQIINEKSSKFPFPVGNCIGGGLHTRTFNFLKPDFQEFLIIPKTRNFFDNVFLMNKAWELIGKRLKLRRALGELNDENAFGTSLGNEEALGVLDKTREELSDEGKVDIGIDAASSSFFTGLLYNYKNPIRKIGKDEQLAYMKSLIQKYRLGYVEDAFYEEDFLSFAELRKEIAKERACLIVGDDLTASQIARFRQALLKRSVNAIIVKPNQNGSLIEVKKIIDAARKYEVATIMSHRSGETLDYSLADFAFGFQADFIKTGIKGREREIKLNRLLEIEKSF